MANRYVLKGNGIEIDYTIGANPSLVALTFKQGGNTRTFTPAQITTDETGLGTLVSVPLLRSVDTGGSRFGFFLPVVPAAAGPGVAVTTIGAIETFSGPNSVPHHPTTWKCLHLQGTAAEVIVPLVATAPA